MNSADQAATQSEVATPFFHRNGSRSRPLHKRAMQFLRRAHLYVGLFMIPWILVYAATGFLLNHYAVWPEREIRPVTTDQVRGTGLDTLPSAAELAAEVTDTLNTRAGRPEYRLSNSVAASFEGETFFVESKAGGEEALLFFDVLTKTGRVEVKPATGEYPAAPFAAPEAVFGRTRLEEQLKAGAPAVLERFGVLARKLEVGLPELRFAVTDAAGREWKVSYDPKSGAVRGRPAGVADPEKRFKQFLYGLHFTAGYPQSARLRTVWAVFVDLTVFALLFWCLTGLLMWWQIKAVRRGGVLVLVSSVVTATLLGSAMHGVRAH